MASPTGRNGGQEFCSGLAPGLEGEMLRIMTDHDFPHNKDLQGHRRADRYIDRLKWYFA